MLYKATADDIDAIIESLSTEETAEDGNEEEVPLFFIDSTGITGNVCSCSLSVTVLRFMVAPLF